MDEHPWTMLVKTLWRNYDRHTHGESTLCSSTREYVPSWMFILGWAGLTSWLVPHYCKKWEWWKLF